MLCTCRQQLLTRICCGTTSAANYYYGSRFLLRHLSTSTAPSQDPQQPSQLPTQRPKLHWTEEFKIRSPKVSPSQLRNQPVVPIDIESDAFVDRRISFVLRGALLRGPQQARLRGIGKILSWCGIASLPYLLFCKWAGGTPLLGDMQTYAVPATVAGLSLGYLGLNLALERLALSRRIYSIALDESDPDLAYITTVPVGGWLHGQYKSYATRLDNISVVMPKGRGSWARLSFKSGGGECHQDWLSLPVSKRKCFVVDARAMAMFLDRCCSSAGSSVDNAGGNSSDFKRFDRVVLPSESEIEQHLDSTLLRDDDKTVAAESGQVEEKKQKGGATT